MMSINLHKNALKKSIFNTANMGGLGALCLSYSVGSLVGTFIFFLAVIIGSLNKYRSILNDYKTKKINPYIKFLQAPALTAQILMLAAFINFLKSSYNAFQATSSDVLYFTFLACAWFFGFLADDMLRRNDTTNFSEKAGSKNQTLLIKAFIYVTRNPVFYYIITNMFFACAIVLSPNQELENISILYPINILVIITSAIGVGYGIWRGFQMILEKITPDQTNNGVINIIIVIANMEVLFIAIIQGLYFVILAQIFFAIANITVLFETRHALKKEKHF